jgi:outer membrane protein OmpA-like peptidoglycan-associated protein
MSVASSRGSAIKLLSESARRNEHLAVFCGRQLIHESASPSGGDIVEAVSVPDPSGMPGETDVQKRRRQAVETRYRQALAEGAKRVADRARQQLERWLAAASAAVKEQPCRSTGGPHDFVSALSQGEAFFGSLDEAKVDVGLRRSIVALGVEGIPLTPSPVLSGHQLRGAALIVSPFPGNLDQQAAWQAVMLHAGAGRVVLLTPGSVTELPRVVNDGLQAESFNFAADALFPLGSSMLSAVGKSALRKVLESLLGKEWGANVVVNGYTDDLPAPGSNEQLSQDRAEAVRRWLIENGISSDLVQAIGHGQRDPVATNGPGGQPANRRVVVVVNPTGHGVDEGRNGEGMG